MQNKLHCLHAANTCPPQDKLSVKETAQKAEVVDETRSPTKTNGRGIQGTKCQTQRKKRYWKPSEKENQDSNAQQN